MICRNPLFYDRVFVCLSDELFTSPLANNLFQLTLASLHKLFCSAEHCTQEVVMCAGLASELFDQVARRDFCVLVGLRPSARSIWLIYSDFRSSPAFCLHDQTSHTNLPIKRLRRHFGIAENCFSGESEGFDRICCRSRIDIGTGASGEANRSWLESRSLPSGRCSHRCFHSDKRDGHADTTVRRRRGSDRPGRRWFATWRACRDWGKAVLLDSESEEGRRT